MPSATHPIDARRSAAVCRGAGASSPFEVSAARSALDRVLCDAGLSLAELERRASEVVLFGSRAAGLASSDSDWDVLLVGEDACVHTGDLDLIWILPSQLTTRQWLGSELANHVATYGLWLRGPGNWRGSVFHSPEQAARKRAAMLFQLSELRRVWSQLLPGARVRHLRRLRREMQRLRLLHEGLAVPPTTLLDQAWRENGSSPADIKSLFEEASAILT